jgi:hypothetical protein
MLTLGINALTFEFAIMFRHRIARWLLFLSIIMTTIPFIPIVMTALTWPSPP